MGSVTVTDGSNSVTITNNLEVTREVGRPNGDLTPKPNALPLYTDKRRPASDVFIINGDVSAADGKTISENFGITNLGTGVLTLTFDSNLFGYSSSFNVMPDGAGAIRVVYSSGQKGAGRVFTEMTLRRVQ